MAMLVLGRVKKQHGKVTKNCSSTFVTLTNFGLAHGTLNPYKLSLQKNWDRFRNRLIVI